MSKDLYLLKLFQDKDIYDRYYRFVDDKVLDSETKKVISLYKKYFHFSTGHMFRNLDKNSEIGKKVHELISGGNFVPDELTIKLFFETIGFSPIFINIKQPVP